MSKFIMNTKDKIRDKALEMFNERGIEYVGLRELAAILGLRVSNITYYFPTKDDLVYALSLELSKKNAAIIVENEALTLDGFLEMLYQAFRHHVQFRCLLLSVVHLMKQNRHMAANYKKTQRARNAALLSNLQSLQKNGFLTPDAGEEMNFLVDGISLISRFWISEAAISFRSWKEEAQLVHALQLIARLLRPYATARGKKDMQKFFERTS